MSKPLFCPQCGKESLNLEPFEGEYDGGYDCYCLTCEWSGDILPDDEADIFGQPALPGKRKGGN